MLGELRIARRAGGPCTTISSFGAAQLDAARAGSSPAQLRSRRDDLAFSLDFRLPRRFTGEGTLRLRLGKVRVAAVGQQVAVTDPVGTRVVMFVEPAGAHARRQPALHDREPARPARGRPRPTSISSSRGCAGPNAVPDVEFSSVTVSATAIWPFQRRPGQCAGRRGPRPRHGRTRRPGDALLRTGDRLRRLHARAGVRHPECPTRTRRARRLVVAIEPNAAAIELLLDGEPVAAFEPTGGGAVKNVQVEHRAADRGAEPTGGVAAEGALLTFENPPAERPAALAARATPSRRAPTRDGRGRR